MRQDLHYVAPRVVQMIKTYPYKKAKLVDHNGDTSKRWYIEYYIWHYDKEELVRVREYKKLNSKAEGASVRRSYARRRLREINYNLRFCALQDIEIEQPTQKAQRLYSLKEAIDEVIKINYPADKNRKTNSTMRTISAKFHDFCAKKGALVGEASGITKADAQRFIDYLKSEKKLHPNTVNNQVAKLKALFNKMISRELCELNPFVNLDLPREIQTKRNQAFNEYEQKQIKAYMVENAPNLWRMVQTLYYCFIRTTEMQRLKIDNVLLDEQKIYIGADQSKNGKGEYVAIPSPLMETFKSMGLENYPGHFYLFGKNGVPGEQTMWTNWPTNKHKEVLDFLGIKGKTFYSWKHTGVVNAYKNGVDIKSIQLQCRHASIEQTDTYLKTLGFVSNEGFLNGFKEL